MENYNFEKAKETARRICVRTLKSRLYWEREYDRTGYGSFLTIADEYHSQYAVEVEMYEEVFSEEFVLTDEERETLELTETEETNDE